MTRVAMPVLTGIAAPLLRDNINTDAIIPSREMKTVSRKGLAAGLFADWRYTAVGGRDPEVDFVLNDARYHGAQILLTGANFGCGSSREHAAWALREFGFRAILAEGFNPIFRNNAVLNGIAPLILPRDVIAALARAVEDNPAQSPLTIDLRALKLFDCAGNGWAFNLDEEALAALRDGLDAIDLTLRHADAIDQFRANDRHRRPWAYP
jgi:3-isopropylmalate/(R)-2-methylmalate dehydratase small subunit